MGRTQLVSAVLALSFALAGCAPSRSDQTNDPVSGVIWSGRDGFIVGPAVELVDGWTYYLWLNSGGLEGAPELRRVKAGGQPEVVVMNSADCSGPHLARLKRLPDGSLGAVQYCLEDPGRYARLVRIDQVSGKSESILDLGSATDVLPTGGNSGWAERAKYGCRSIAPVVDSHLAPAPHLQPDSLLGWPIDQGFRQESCIELGQIGFPQESGGGQVIVLASPKSRGVDPGPLGEGRKNVEWSLYGFGSSVGMVRLLAGPFVRPSAMTVTIDKSSAIVAAEIRGKPGIWSVNLDSGAITLVAEQNADELTATSDGKSVVSVGKSNGVTSIMRVNIGA